MIYDCFMHIQDKRRRLIAQTLPKLWTPEITFFKGYGYFGIFLRITLNLTSVFLFFSSLSIIRVWFFCGKKSICLQKDTCIHLNLSLSARSQCCFPTLYCSQTKMCKVQINAFVFREVTNWRRRHCLARLRFTTRWLLMMFHVPTATLSFGKRAKNNLTKLIILFSSEVGLLQMNDSELLQDLE